MRKESSSSTQMPALSKTECKDDFELCLASLAGGVEEGLPLIF
jgi:hypothetical protein